MRKFFGIGLIAVSVVLLDQLAKHLVMRSIPLLGKVPVIDGFFELVHVRNRGAAFGFLSRSDGDWQFWFFTAATILAVAVIVYLARSTPEAGKIFYCALGFLLGGAAGNFIDRLRFRHVVDFLDFYVADWHWPAFNVADIAITCGVILLAGVMLFGKKPEQSSEY